MMELSLTRARLRRGSDAELNDGFPVRGDLQIEPEQDRTWGS